MEENSNNFVQKLSETVLQHQKDAELSQEEFNKLPPDERLRRWKKALESLSSENFEKWDLPDKEQLVKEYNALVEEREAKGITSESTRQNLEQFSATLKRTVALRVDVVKLRKQLKIKGQ
ncbi:MAG TPA: hypothetical protein VJH94_01980 [Candidatus Paceibacterota bacterium]